ncbi:alkaline phosphatase [Desulfosarcina widdelii]|uniref:Alkaline phosphatase n=1 Tax=Desulfosarcina widdelii TaxID=947919 RepID=A0A5K7ZF19_9BACT|nr:alkaline phosphatase [Desulfosarcina widdelii]BBO78381.1 alkaline phosphatase [Desulfosarcina widdelii]
MSRRVSVWKICIMALAAASLCMGTASAGSKWKNQWSWGNHWGNHGGHQCSSGPKYVFYFIGDGMASPQIHATEAYLAALTEDDTVAGGVKANKLIMSEFPVQGMQMSFANNRFITGSAAAGTALACGKKTNIGVISMDPDATENYTSLAEAAKARGMKVGIVSSVSIDHATPAVFYAHEASRNNYEQIGEWLLNSDFDYFGGGGFRVNKYSSDTYDDLSNDERYALVETTAVKNGFTFANTREEFDALNRRTGRAIAVNPDLDSSNAIPYALNRMAADGPGEDYEDSISLAEFTEKGIELMQKNRCGFFMMVEGGKIDWACHANDARAAIEDTIAFDDAIGVAVAFAKKHPSDTLIVVTGDHECGGMTLGFAGTVYETYYEKMAAQTIAYDDFGLKTLANYVAAHQPLPEDIDGDMWQIILATYGMDGAGLTPDSEDDLTEYEISLLEDAFDKTMSDENENTGEENDLLYGTYDPLSVTLTHLLNRKSGLAWTSYSHTAVPVPVLAMGAGSEIFDGYYDNTDVAKKIAKIMKVRIGD